MFLFSFLLYHRPSENRLTIFSLLLFNFYGTWNTKNSSFSITRKESAMVFLQTDEKDVPGKIKVNFLFERNVISVMCLAVVELEKKEPLKVVG